ncbi:MAG: PQQ-binding-like beta-propeller repeat protein [Gemmatimonadota bacterium]|nr:PQQ-binding-like beta-propeller repeat protein [Gemmatimonadota bacterium]
MTCGRSARFVGLVVATGMALAVADTAGQDDSGRSLLSPPPRDGSPGHLLYEASCESCHSGDESTRAPRLTALGAMTPRAIVAALTSGRMRRHGEDLSEDQRVAVAEWLTGSELVETRMPDDAFCAARPTGPGEVAWSGWGGGDGETGYRGAATAGITAADLGDLELAWAFAFPDVGQVRSKPAVVGDRVLVGSAYGEVYSIDLETGCLHWSFSADAAVRGGIAIGEGPGGTQAAFFADFRANTYAIDAATGELLWRAATGEHADHTNTGTVAVHDGRVFVPISSMEVVTAGDPRYECCTASGGVVALSSETGEPLWEYWTIGEEPRAVGETEVGTTIFAPSGAPVWSSPTVDAVRGLLYVGTGENYTRPTTASSDAIIALDLASGLVRWSFQAREGDAWNMACGLEQYFQNCPLDTGPDFDFGMAPIIVAREDGSQVLVAGQKSGMVWALDPDTGGELVWARKVGRGSALGGIHWGIASDGRRVYVPNADHVFVVTDPRTGEHADPSGAEPMGTGVYALDLGAGEVLWHAGPDTSVCAGRVGCMPFFSAAATAIDGAVLAGSLDGHMRAWSSEDGSLLWDVDTAREFETVNGVAGRGGAIDGPGPVVAHGTVLIGSGYDMFGEMPGNVLLAYRKPR